MRSILQGIRYIIIGKTMVEGIFEKYGRTKTGIWYKLKFKEILIYLYALRNDEN